MTDQKIAYLGPPGTFTEEAAACFAGDDQGSILCAYPTIEQVACAVEKNEAEKGVLPLENSLEGSVTSTLDYLAGGSCLFICAEMIRPVIHCLLALTPGDHVINKIYSHSQALAQCRRYLQTHYPGVELEPVASTAQASALVARGERDAAAVAPARAAENYGLHIRAHNIADSPANATRFIVVSRGDSPPSGRDKTSVIVGIRDCPGSLYDLLGIFAQNKINLTRIESRPARTNIGEYFFFIDFEGHRQEKKIQSVMANIKEQSRYLKILGSYPSCRGGS